MQALTTPYRNPLPPVVHQTLTTTQNGQLRGEGRCVFVGDIHGCCESLEQLLDKVGFERGVDNLLLVGDLVGKGPDTYGVLRLAQELGAFVVMGNWEDKALKQLKQYQKGKKELCKDDHWIKHLGDPDHQGDLEFIRRMPFTLTLPELGIVVVHAGLVPNEPSLHAQPLDALIEMKDLDFKDGSWTWSGMIEANTRQAASSVDDGSSVGDDDDDKDGSNKHDEKDTDPWSKHWRGPYHVIFGHNAARKLQKRECATGLDTACVKGRAKGGKLTAMVVPSRKCKSLNELIRSGGLSAKVASGQPVTRDDLDAELFDVFGPDIK